MLINESRKAALSPLPLVHTGPWSDSFLDRTATNAQAAKVHESHPDPSPDAQLWYQKFSA